MKTDVELLQLAKEARLASQKLACISSEVKNKVIKKMAESLLKNKKFILQANRKDVQLAKKEKLSQAFVDRLALNDQRIEDMADALLEIVRLDDPVGEVIKAWRRPNGLWIHKVRTPLGVVAIIYESRPNVTVESAGLCLKAGNSVILKGGSESLNSNISIHKLLVACLKEEGLPENTINLIASPSRKSLAYLLKLNQYIDVVIPRGGEGLIKYVTENSLIPVIKHYKGLCHIYVDEFADLNMAQRICFNAKVQRPGVCNAMETMLVHKDVAARFLPGMAREFVSAGVQLRGCPVTCRIIKTCRPATEKDFFTEYLDLILSVKVVGSLQEAVEHINHYGSHHSDAIITDSYEAALEFVRQVDSACVYINASTRFTDGYQFGLGAEIGISTDKLHCRGPMALEELTTYKYIVFGNGQIRE